MLSKEELLKAIENIPLFECLDVATIKDEKVERQPDFKAIVEAGKTEAVAIVSRRYALVQMKEIFGQVLSQMSDDTEGELFYYGGHGQLHLFPKDSRVGICVCNSVDASGAIKIFFVARANGSTLYLSREKIAEYKRLHIGSPLESARNFSEMLTDAQEAWHSIVNKLSNVPLTEDIIAEVKKAVDTKKLAELVDKFRENNIDRYVGRSLTLWDLLLAVLKAASESRFKSEIHRQERLRKLSALLLAFALRAK
jgi:hypothetical protein